MSQQERGRITRNRRLWRLGTRQMIVTLVLIVIINLAARRLGLGFGGSIVLCALVAFCWPFIATWWSRRRH